MIGVATKFTNRSNRVTKATKKASFENLRHGALSIRKDASRSIKHKKNREKVAPKGQPPTQHKPGFFKRALWADWNDESAVTGFRESRVDHIAATHEHGLEEEGREYPERATMYPALLRNVERFHRDWRATIG
jgi:hypothetical protein